MKEHHEYKKIPLGDSDIAQLTVTGMISKYKIGSETLDMGRYPLYLPVSLRFLQDGSYKAYLVDGECEVPGTYDLKIAGCDWFKIYDDHAKVFDSGRCKTWEIYRRGDFGCIIKIVREE